DKSNVISNGCKIVAQAIGEIVNHRDVCAVPDKRFAQMRTDEPRAAGDADVPVAVHADKRTLCIGLRHTIAFTSIGRSSLLQAACDLRSCAASESRARGDSFIA